MTRKLEALFDLPPEPEESAEAAPPPVEDLRTQLQNLDETIDKVDAALPGVRGLESSDEEMDGLAEMAKDSYKDLMDLGMQVDSRFSAEIFGVAGTMLGHAITAKTAKINKKLKMIELQLKKAALDQKQQSKDEEVESTPLGEGKALDRNELLRMLAQKSTDK